MILNIRCLFIICLHKIRVDFDVELISSIKKMTNFCCVCNFSEIPVTFTLTLVDLNTLEHEDACFKCELSKADVKINWYKNDKKIKSDNIKYKSKQKGKKRTLTIYDVDENDMGKYSIRLNGHDSSSAMLVVKGKGQWCKYDENSGYVYHILYVS